MMDQGRAQNVGKVLAVAATLRYRDIFPMIGRIALNSNHTTTAAIFKERGMKVFFIQKSGKFIFFYMQSRKVPYDRQCGFKLLPLVE